MEKGARLGPYRILSNLGAGSTASVHLAEVTEAGASVALGRRVALKILHPHFEANLGALRRFLREVRVGRAIDHPNVVRLLDAGTLRIGQQRRHYLAMDYVEGSTLRELLVRDGAQPEALCRHIGREVACGLDRIHAAGAIHRDLKPENVFITVGQQVKIMDLGVAQLRDVSAPVSRAGDFVGSVLYAAPEQFRDGGVPLDGRADLYALGLTLYELVTGTHPFPADSIGEVMRRHEQVTPVSPCAHGVRLTPFFEHVVLTLLRKSPDDRFRSASEVQQVLGEGEGSTWWRELHRSLRRDSRRTARRIASTHRTECVGREAEILTLRGLWNDVRLERGRAALLLGESGCGKTRLWQELIARLDADAEDVDILHGVCPRGGAATADGAFCTAWREFFGHEELPRRLAPHLAASPGVLGPFVALLRGEGIAPYAGSTSETLHAAFVRTAQSLSLRRPLVIVIEDLQYAPIETQSVFEELARAVSRHRILLVGTGSKGPATAWLRRLSILPDVHRMTVGRLDPHGVTQLVTAALSSERLGARLAPFIADRSDGNPLFAFEILQALEHEGALVRDADGAYVLERPIDAIGVPPRMQDVLLERVRGLPETDREFLDVAAVYGYHFDPLVLAEVLETPRIPVLMRLAVLESQSRLVRFEGRRCRFDHHLLRQTLYDAVPVARREAYHAAIGRALGHQRKEASAGAREPARAVEACQHLLAGGQGALALEVLDESLDHLEAGHLCDRSVALMDRVLAFPDLLAGKARAALLLRKAERLAMLGRRPQEAAALEEAVHLASRREAPALASRARTRLARYLHDSGHGERAVAFLEQSIAIARGACCPREEAEAHGALGAVCTDLGRYEEALRCHRRHLAYARAAADAVAEAKARRRLAVTLLHRGETQAALGELQRSLVLLASRGDVYEQCRVAGELGHCQVQLGLFEDARQSLEAGLQAARRSGYRRGEASALGHLGAVHLCTGRWAEAQACYDADLAIQRECGTHLDEGVAHHNLGELSLLLGRVERARAHLSAALDRFRDAGFRRGEFQAQTWLARAAEEVGERADADERQAAALCIAEALGSPEDLATACAERLRTLVFRGDHEAAGAWLLAHASRLSGSARVETRLLVEAAEVVLGTGDGEAVVRDLEGAGARITPALRLDVYALLWRGTGRSEHLQAACHLLDTLAARAPDDARETFPSGLRLHRDLAAAWASTGERA